MRNIIWNVRQEKLRINTFTLQRTCVIVYETLMSQASAASGRGEGGARPSPHSKIFVFKSLQSWGGSPKHSSNCAQFFEVFALFLTWLSLYCEGQRRTAETRQTSLMNCHHHNHYHQYLAKFLYTPSKERGRKQYFRSEYFGLCDVSNLNIFSFSGF